MLAFAEVSIGGVGIRCRRCPGADEARETPPSEIVDAVRRAAPDAGGCVALAGGDLFARDSWVETVSGALAAGAKRLRVDAGPALAAPGVAEETLSRGVRHVRVHLLAADPAVGDALVRVPGYTSAALATVRVFVDAAAARGVRAMASALVPVCRHDLHELPSTVTALAEAGIISVELRVGDPSLPPAPAARWLAAAADSGTVNRVWVTITGVPRDTLPGYELHFTEPFAVGGAA